VSKRYFRIPLGNYGGEVTMGTVSREFAEYWEDRDNDELLEHVLECGWADDELPDPDSPAMTEDGENYARHDIDDFMHINGAYSDNRFVYEEIKLKEGITFDGEYYRRGEEYVSTYDAYDVVSDEYIELEDFVSTGYEMYSASKSDDTVPVLIVHSSEKGLFGEAVVVTEGEDLDPRLVCLVSAETDHGEFVTDVYYAGEPVIINFDSCDTTGKGMYASVGYVNPDWLDESPDQEAILETYADYDIEL